MSDVGDRRKVLDALSLGWGRFPSEVARRAGLSTTKVTRILKDLVKDGVVQTAVTSEGRTTYSLN